MQLDVALQLQEPQAFAEHVVLDVVDPLDDLVLAVADPDRIVKELAQKRARGHVGELVDRGREHRAAVLEEMLGIVRSAPQETDPHGRS